MNNVYNNDFYKTNKNLFKLYKMIFFLIELNV